MALFEISLPGEREPVVPVAAGLTALVGLGAERRRVLIDALRRWAAGDAAALSVTQAGRPVPPTGAGDAPSAMVVDADDLARFGGLGHRVVAAPGAVTAHAAASAALDALDEVLDVLEARMADTAAGRAAALAAVARCELHLDHDVPAAVVRLREEVCSTPEDGVGERQERIDALTAAAITLASADARPVAAALDGVRRSTSTVAVPSREALLLADEWASLRRQLEVAERRLARRGIDLERAGRELDEARSRVELAEDSARRPTMSPDEMSGLEEAHEAVLDAERKASSRLGGARARKALEAAMAAEREILDRHGYPTWSAWVMGDRLLDATAKAKREAALARRDVARAEAAWADTLTRLDADPSFAELMGRLDDLYQRSVDIVGEHDDVEPVLRRVTVGGEPGLAGLAANGDDPSAMRRQRLRDALAGAGVDTDDDAPLDDLLDAADAWLDAVAPLVGLRGQVEEALRHAEADLAIVLDAAAVSAAPRRAGLAAEQPGAAATEPGDSQRSASADEREAVSVATMVPSLRRAALQRRLEQAEARRERHEQALLELTDRWCEALAARQVHAGTVAERDAKRELWDLSFELERSAAVRLGPAASLAAAMAARSRLVRRDGQGPLVVLDEAVADHAPDTVRAAVAHLCARRPRTPVLWLLDGDLPEGLEPGPGLTVVAASGLPTR